MSPLMITGKLEVDVLNKNMHINLLLAFLFISNFIVHNQILDYYLNNNQHDICKCMILKILKMFVIFF